MNGIHDLGGMHGFGPVEPEADEPPFHGRWEGRCLALNRVMGACGIWNIDQARAGIEVLPPQVYLESSYYAKWALRLQNMLVEREVVGEDELGAGHALRPAAGGAPQALPPADAETVLVRGAYARDAQTAPRFKPGDRVRARNIHPHTHTRLPRYARGHIGVVEFIRGCHVFPDSSAIGHGENPQWLYAVRFDGRELWGEDADPSLTVSIEAFEPYLDAA